MRQRRPLPSRAPSGAALPSGVTRRQVLHGGLGLAGVAALSACGVTRGDAGQSRLRMMIPNNPGGGYDLTGRQAVKVMEDADLTPRFEVFNVVGASGTVAMSRLLNESGNEDLLMSMGLGVVGAVYTNKSSATVDRAVPICKLIEESEGILVPVDSPFETIDDLVTAWQADPGSLSLGGGSSPGGPDHLFPMQLAKTLGIQPTDVNYTAFDGGGPLLSAILGAKIDMATSGLGEYLKSIEDGDMRVLATSGDKPVPGVDAPRLTEAGIDLVFANWRGILAPPGIPRARVDEHVALLTEMHGTQAWKDVLETQGWTDSFAPGEEFGTFLQEQNDRVSGTLTELGLV